MIGRMSLLLAIGAMGMSAGAAPASTDGTPWIAARVILEQTGGAAATPSGRGLLKNPGSYIVVRTVRVEEPIVAADKTGPTGRLIPVPENARAGDPAYAEAPAEEYVEYYYEDHPTVYGPYGTIFADGIELGYSALKKHGPGRHGRHRSDNGRRRDRHDHLPEFGANDLHRSAQLKFAESAQPRLEGLDDGFRRAQLQFHRSTLTPGVRRSSDGLRHERSSSRPSRPSRPGRGPR
jgi:hypothetical protein